MVATKALMLGVRYYVPCPAHRSLYIKREWEGSEFDYMRLSRGIVHTTAASAVKHAARMIEVTYEG